MNIRTSSKPNNAYSTTEGTQSFLEPESGKVNLALDPLDNLVKGCRVETDDTPATGLTHDAIGRGGIVNHDRAGVGFDLNQTSGLTFPIAIVKENREWLGGFGGGIEARVLQPLNYRSGGVPKWFRDLGHSSGKSIPTLPAASRRKLAEGE